MQNYTSYDLIVVGGPTATGKTQLAIQTAKYLNGIILNADSVQVYKHLDIGSNKGKLELASRLSFLGFEVGVYYLDDSGIEGVLFNLVEPSTNFNLADYVRYATSMIEYSHSIGKIPILTGGSGLYIDAIIKGYSLNSEEIDRNKRAKLNSMSTYELSNIVKSISKKTFEALNNSDKNNPRRLIRLIEKFGVTKQDNQNNKPKYNYLFLYPEYEKELLMDRIDKRVLEMFDDGFVAEVKQLITNGYGLNDKALLSTGYKEIAQMLINNEYSISDCISMVQLAHRKYAKRQITWFEGQNRGYDLVRVSNSTLKDTLSSILPLSSFSV